MALTSVEFASLLCSRLCHDLLSPVGAIGNGLELLADEDEPAMRERVLALITESTLTATNKLKFFRLAFGAGGGMGEEIDARDLRSAITGITGEKVELAWAVEQSALPKREARLLLNLALIGAEALVRGGTLTAAAEPCEVVVRAEGPRIAIDDAVLATLRGETAQPDISARTAAAWLTADLAGGSLQVVQDEGMLMFGAAVG